MRISLNWLGEFIDWTETDPRAIAERITVRTAEVEKLEIQGEFLKGVVVGEVVSMSKHPKADRLSLVDVRTDQGAKRCVCGGTNLRIGQIVAFAHVGATVKWHGGETVTLEKAIIRGEHSEGMICAAEELDLGEAFPPAAEDGERPILDLSRSSLKDPKSHVGEPLAEALNRTDTVLLFSNTAITQRPDLFSHLGFARECVAIGLATWKRKPSDALPKFPGKPMPFRIKNDTGQVIPRYLACLIDIDSVGETPAWMRARLEATGWRCVSLPVDITNYVSMEVGMPLHSFDAGDLKGDMTMHLSEAGDTLVTLDGVERTLPDGAVVLSDADGIFDLLGIMGGLRSSTKPTTKKILLHSAVVDPVSIRRGIVGTGHRTDASTVYEKGIPRMAARLGFARALQLMLELVPGARIGSALEEFGDDGEAPTIPLFGDDVRRTLGLDISDDEILLLLETLECKVRRKKGSRDLHVTPPLHRLRDLQGPHDLIDEVIRVYGLDRLSPQIPLAPLRLPERDNDVHTLRESLRADGFNEIVPLSLVGPELLRKANLDPAMAVSISNPLGETLSLLQPSLLPGLLEHARSNLLRADDAVRAFQWGHIFLHDADAPDSPVTEETRLGALLAVKRPTALTDDPTLHLKRTLAAMLGRIRTEVTFVPHEAPPAWAHPGRTAMVLKDGAPIGILAEVHPSVSARFDLPARTAYCSVSIDALAAPGRPAHHASALPQFPEIVYDVTLPRDHADSAGDLLSKLRESHPLLASAGVHDLYGKTATGSYNLTLRFTYRAADRTLTEDEAKKAHEEVMKAIA